jgi:hypothetical protein
MRLREQGQAAFGYEVDAPRGNGFLNRTHKIIEANAEIRVVPADERSLETREKEPKILSNDIGIQ